MQKLILNPKKISLNKKVNNFFIDKYFINFLKKDKLKKINYSYPLRRKHNKFLNYNYKNIYKKILNELYPILNKIHKLSWSYKTWNFFLAPWLYFYIVIVLDKINNLKNIEKFKINTNEQIKNGKNVCLASYDFDEFKNNITKISYNEKLFSRLLYLKKFKNFKNNFNYNRLNKIYINKNNNFFYTLKIFFLKIFLRIFSKNNIVFYNSYFGNFFFYFKIFLKLKKIPIKYNYNFFDNKIQKIPFDVTLRKKIVLSTQDVNFNIKLLKFLLPEIIPNIYLESFKSHIDLAKNSHLPKKVKKIFTCITYKDNIFKFWLANQYNSGAEIYYGQHGAGYNMFKKKYNFLYDYEKDVSKKRLIWGSKKDSKKEINVGNFLIKSNKKTKFINNKNFLLVLPRTDIFRPVPHVWYEDLFDEQVKEFQAILDNLNYNFLNNLDIREHPKNINRFLSFKNFLNTNSNTKYVNINSPFQNICENHSLIIFSYLSTEFLKQLSLNKPCVLFINKKYFNNFISKDCKQDFSELHNAGIFFTDAKKLSNKINLYANNLQLWWNNKKTKKIVKKFCLKYSDSKFKLETFSKLFIN